MIYWLTGQPGAGKTVLGKKLVKFFKQQKIPVFHIDGDNLRKLTQNFDYTKEGRYKNITQAQELAKQHCQDGEMVVVSVVAPYIELREAFKKEMGDQLIEFYVHTTEARERDHFHSKDYVKPEENFVDLDTTQDDPELSFNKILQAWDERKQQE